MDFSVYSDLVTDAVTGLGTEALTIFGAVILLGGGVFLIRWGYRKATHGLRGKV